MPQLLVAVAVAQFPARRIAALVGAALIFGNLSVVNTYLVGLDQTGAHGLFTDAFEPLSAAVSSYRGDTIYPVDYGIGDSLNLLQRGRLNMQREWAVPQMPGDRVEAMIADPKGIFIDRLAGNEYFRGTMERLTEVAQRRGYRLFVLRTVCSSTGRPEFQLFRFVR